MAHAGPDKGRIERARKWIASVYGHNINGDLFAALKDGVILCETVNKIKPGTCKKYKSSSVAFVCRQNIEIFIKGAKALGVAQNDCFETRDLYDGQRPDSVIVTIEALSVVSETDFHIGQGIGAKRASKNVRQFTQEQLNKSKSAVPLWNQGDKHNDTGSKHDSYGIIKNKDVTKHSGVQSTWEKGSIANDTGSKHDSYGIVKNKDVTKHSGVQSTWEKGSIANDTGSQHDSYGIIKNKNVTKHSGVQSTWEKGSIANDTGSSHDSYGIIKNKNQTKSHFNAKDAKISNNNNTGSQHDSYGVVRQPNHLNKK